MNRAEKRRTQANVEKRRAQAKRQARAVDTAHHAAVTTWEESLRAAERENAVKLRDPAHCASLGLPAALPEFTIGVLAQTQALSLLGPKRPRRSDKVQP